MKKQVKVRTTSLTKLLMICQDQDETPASDGFFDENKNYHPDREFPEYYVLTPWEWVVIPEIVAFAKESGVEVPEDPPFDISRTF